MGMSTCGSSANGRMSSPVTLNPATLKAEMAWNTAHQTLRATGTPALTKPPKSASVPSTSNVSV